jgi:hypothetical protein
MRSIPQFGTSSSLLGITSSNIGNGICGTSNMGSGIGSGSNIGSGRAALGDLNSAFNQAASISTPSSKIPVKPSMLMQPKTPRYFQLENATC